MKKILVWFYLLLKRQLNNPALIIILIGLPACTAIINNIPAMSENSAARVGIVYNTSDKVSSAAVNTLLSEDNELEFYVVDSQEELMTDIARGSTECGYIFSDDLTDRLNKKRYNDSIILVKNSSELISSLANEVIFAAMFKEYAGKIAIDYVRREYMMAAAGDMVLERYNYYMNGSATFHIDFQTISDGDLNQLNVIEVKNAQFPIRGILAVLIYCAGVFGSIQWKTDYENGVFTTLSVEFRSFSRIIYVKISTLLFGISSLITLYAADEWNGIISEGVQMIAYIVLVTAFGVLLSVIVPNSRILISMLPIFIIGSLTLCPVLIDITLYLPIAKWLDKLFLPYYYLTWFS